MDFDKIKTHVEQKVLPKLRKLGPKNRNTARTLIRNCKDEEKIKLALGQLNLNHNLNLDYDIILESYKGKTKSKLKELKKIPKEIEEILESPDLLKIINQELGKKIYQETPARLIVFVFAIGRLLENAEATSFNLCLSDTSGLGKDFITKKVLELFTEGEQEEYLRAQKITPETLEGLSKKIDWAGKILYLEDIRQNVLSGETFKVFASGSKNFYTFRDGEAKKIEVKGKPTMIISTAKGVFSDEIARRFVSLGLTSGEKQTKGIMLKQAKAKEQGTGLNYSWEIRQALKFLKSEKVIIPFASQLPKHFGTQDIMRTQFNRFLDIIGAITLLHQYQREKNEEGYLIATWEDYDRACWIFENLFKENSRYVSLSKTQSKVIQAFKKNPGINLIVSDIENETHLTTKTINRILQYLADFDFVKIGDLTENEKTERGIKRPTKCYYLTENLEGLKLKRSEEIKWIKSTRIKGRKQGKNEQNNKNKDKIESNFTTSNKFNTFNTFNPVNNSQEHKSESQTELDHKKLAGETT